MDLDSDENAILPDSFRFPIVRSPSQRVWILVELGKSSLRSEGVTTVTESGTSGPGLSPQIRDIKVLVFLNTNEFFFI